MKVHTPKKVLPLLSMRQKLYESMAPIFLEEISFSLQQVLTEMSYRIILSEVLAGTQN